MIEIIVVYIKVKIKNPKVVLLSVEKDNIRLLTIKKNEFKHILLRSICIRTSMYNHLNKFKKNIYGT